MIDKNNIKLIICLVIFGLSMEALQNEHFKEYVELAIKKYGFSQEVNNFFYFSAYLTF